jgi:hypothetical protein
MNKTRSVVLPVCFLVGCGLLAAVNFAPLLKNAEEVAKVLEWVGACLIGTAAVASVLIAIRNRVEPLLSEEIWGKHRPAKERLSNVRIDDMIRAERQFILYRNPTSLSVLLTMLMHDNQISEDDICRNLSPLIEFRGHNSLWYSMGILTKPWKQQQVKQRENVVKNVISSIENMIRSHNTPNGMPLQYDNTNHTQAPIERTRDVVHTVIKMHMEGHRQEDIVELLDKSIAKHRVITALKQSPPVPNRGNETLSNSL